MKFILVAILATILSACATQTFTLQDSPADIEPKQEDMQTFFIGGIGQEQAINAAEICGGADKVAKIEAKERFWDGVLGLVTYGIYTPRTAKVYCTM